MGERIALPAAIEALYGIFAGYPLRAPMPACLHCMPLAYQKHLATTPLRQLRGDDLQRYIVNALYTCGDADDLRYFLPRILELLCDPQERRALPDLFVIFGKLPYGHWETWPEQEQRAITNYMLAWWREILTYDESVDVDLAEFLKELCDAHIDCAPLLQLWQETRTPSALRQLAQFLRYQSWNGNILQYAPIHAWLRQPAIKVALEEGFYAYMDEPWAEELTYAVESLEWLSNKT